MQMPELHSQKNSLFTAMNRFIRAVNNMDQTVMVPSLLRDVPLDNDKEQQSLSNEPGSYLRDAEADMYSYYTHLKSIRNEIEWGAVRAEEYKRKERAAIVQEPEKEDIDLEQLLQFHLSGLHGVLAKLTSQANDLTNRYKQEIGISGWGQ